MVHKEEKLEGKKAKTQKATNNLLSHDTGFQCAIYYSFESNLFFSSFLSWHLIRSHRTTFPTMKRKIYGEQ